MIQNTNQFKSKVKLQLEMGRFLIKTIDNSDELKKALQLRYQVFQVEMIGYSEGFGEDQDEFDLFSDHLAIYDLRSEQMIATCRLNSSLFSSHFYSSTEFNCQSLLARSETKLEIGRVCVHKDFRNGVIIMMLWRAIAKYMIDTDSKIIFGCGSVMTQKADEAHLLYLYLQEEKKLRPELEIFPLEKYRSNELMALLKQDYAPLTKEQKQKAAGLLPSLCKSYFDIGCYISGPPAFDREFKCIDFLTILESDELSSRIRQKIMSN